MLRLLICALHAVVIAIAHRYTLLVMQVELALIPAVSGDFGVMPGHVPTVAQLRPGVVAIHNEMDKDVERYFVSGGFAAAHADSTMEVTVVEAAKLEDLDKQAIKSGLAEYTARCASANGASACTTSTSASHHADSSVVLTGNSVAPRAEQLLACRLASASQKNDDMEAAIAQVGIEVYSAMDSATA